MLGCLPKFASNKTHTKKYFDCLFPPVLHILYVTVVTTLPAVVTMVTLLLLLMWPLQLHYLRLPKGISEDHVILMDSTVSTGAAAMMAVRVLLVLVYKIKELGNESGLKKLNKQFYKSKNMFWC